MAKAIISKALLVRIGYAVIEKIRENTDKGFDQDGKPFEKYSSNPLKIPAGAFFAPGWKTTGKRLIKNKEAAYRRKNGKYWVLVPGGYAKLKSSRFPQDGGRVNLHVTGNLLNSIDVIKNGDDYVVIGFNNKEAATKAIYHQIMGAGKRKVIRKFLGLPDNEIAKIMADFEHLITAEIDNKLLFQILK
ncbi:MAG: hypothetical protein QXF70_03455 [Candidatus Bilamarchaeaceae archaeon]